GIRDFHVTGVQTCALPIYDHALGVRLDQPAPGVSLAEVLETLDTPSDDRLRDRRVLIGGPVERDRGFVLHTDDWISDETSLSFRSEERRVGKESRHGRGGA